MALSSTRPPNKPQQSPYENTLKFTRPFFIGICTKLHTIIDISPLNMLVKKKKSRSMNYSVKKIKNLQCDEVKKKPGPWSGSRLKLNRFFRDPDHILSPSSVFSFQFKQTNWLTNAYENTGSSAEVKDRAESVALWHEGLEGAWQWCLPASATWIRNNKVQQSEPARCGKWWSVKANHWPADGQESQRDPRGIPAHQGNTQDSPRFSTMDSRRDTRWFNLMEWNKTWLQINSCDTKKTVLNIAEMA